MFSTRSSSMMPPESQGDGSACRFCGTKFVIGPPGVTAWQQLLGTRHLQNKNRPKPTRPNSQPDKQTNKQTINDQTNNSPLAANFCHFICAYRYHDSPSIHVSFFLRAVSVLTHVHRFKRQTELRIWKQSHRSYHAAAFGHLWQLHPRGQESLHQNLGSFCGWNCCGGWKNLQKVASFRLDSAPRTIPGILLPEAHLAIWVRDICQTVESNQLLSFTEYWYWNRKSFGKLHLPEACINLLADCAWSLLIVEVHTI